MGQSHRIYLSQGKRDDGKTSVLAGCISPSDYQPLRGTTKLLLETLGSVF